MLPVGETNRQDPVTCFAYAGIPLFGLAVANILSYDAGQVSVAKGVLCQIERDAMLQLILPVLFFVPFKAGLTHDEMISRSQWKSNT